MDNNTAQFLVNSSQEPQSRNIAYNETLTVPITTAVDNTLKLFFSFFFLLFLFLFFCVFFFFQLFFREHKAWQS